MNSDNVVYERLASEYAKIKCPVCGKSPRLEVLPYGKFNSLSCGHQEVELLIQQTDQRCVASLSPDRARTIRLVPPSKK